MWNERVSRRWASAGALLAVAAAMASAGPSDPPTFVGNGMGQVSFLRFSPNGKELVRVCQFGPVEMLATDRYDRMRTFEIGMRMVAFSADGKRLATAEGTDGARVWDATLSGRSLEVPEEPAGPVKEIRVLETPLHVLETQSSEGTSSVQTRADEKRVLWAEFSPDGTRLLTAQAGGHVKLWNAATGSPEADLAIGDVHVLTAVFAPDGKTILVGDAEGVLHEWDLEQKKEVRAVRAPGAVTQIVFAPDGSGFATVHVLEAKPGATWPESSVVFWGRDRQVVETKAEASSVAFSKDGKRLAIGGKRVDFLDPTSRKAVRTVDLPAVTMRESNPAFADMEEADTKIPVSVTALAFSPDGTILAAGCMDGSIRLVKVAP